MRSHTFYLFGMPSVLTSIGSIMNLGGTGLYCNMAPNGAIADEMAIRADWMTVGNDMRAAISQFRSEHPDLFVEQPKAAPAKPVGTKKLRRR